MQKEHTRLGGFKLTTKDKVQKSLLLQIFKYFGSVVNN